MNCELSIHSYLLFILCISLFLGKPYLNELLFLYLSLKNKPQEQFHPTSIGTFIHHWLVDIQKSGNVPYIKEAFSSLVSLMTIENKKLNILSLAKQLAQNEFSNINNFKSYEIGDEFMMTCVQYYTTLHEDKFTNINSEEIQKKFTKRSPCDAKSIHPACQKYCQYQKEESTKLSKEQKLAMMR